MKSLTLFILLVLLFISPEWHAGAQSSNIIYFPTVSVSGTTISLTMDDIYLGGCWTGWDRCVYVLQRPLFEQILNDQAGSIDLDGQIYYKIDIITFANDEEFQDYIWSENGTGVWIQGLGNKRVILFR
jgi:hypothetical protein